VEPAHEAPPGDQSARPATCPRRAASLRRSNASNPSAGRAPGAPARGSAQQRHLDTISATAATPHSTPTAATLVATSCARRMAVCASLMRTLSLGGILPS